MGKSFGSPRLLPSHARNKTRNKVRAILELHLSSRDQQIQQAWIINLFKRGFSRKRRDCGENFGKFACLFR